MGVENSLPQIRAEVIPGWSPCGCGSRCRRHRGVVVECRKEDRRGVVKGECASEGCYKPIR